MTLVYKNPQHKNVSFISGWKHNTYIQHSLLKYSKKNLSFHFILRILYTILFKAIFYICVLILKDI
jgi:hypothetical protein